MALAIDLPNDRLLRSRGSSGSTWAAQGNQAWIGNSISLIEEAANPGLLAN